MLLVLLAACSMGEAASSQSAAPTAPSAATTPSTSPTVVPSPTRATVEPSPSPAAAQLEVGSPAVVLVPDLNVREGPGPSYPVKTVAPGAPTSGQPIQATVDDIVWIIEQFEADGVVWYRIVQDRSYTTGWVSGGQPNDPWLAPYDPSRCPASFAEAVESAAPMVGSMREFICFGSEPIASVVYWLPAEAQSDVTCPWPELEPKWLMCHEWVNGSGDARQQLPIYGTQDRDDIHRGEWVTVTGHYDDPRSTDCPQALGRDLTDYAEVEATILSCRMVFVLDEVRAAPTP